MSLVRDLTGLTFGSLSVLGVSDAKARDGGAMWLCKCECGNIKSISSRGLIHDNIRACGCKRLARHTDSKISPGMKFGRLLTIKKDIESVGESKWVCRCDCGNEFNAVASRLVSGKTKSCGCLILDYKTRFDMIGKVFGKLTVVEMRKNSKKETVWLCRCECGGEKITTTGALEWGATKSCGCLIGNPTHGDYNERIRRIWVGMMARCYSTNIPSYVYYGGKGILVCEEWHEYTVFKEWAFANGYEEHLTLDRFPNKTGNYGPDNCRWATYKQQANNKTNNHILLIDGVERTISQWADIYSISQLRIASRIRRGWDAKDAVSRPIDTTKRNKLYSKCP